MFKRILILFLILALATPAWAIKYKGDLESNESVTLPEQGTTPANPVAGKQKFYVKDDGNVYVLDSSGNENPVAGSTFKNKIINGGFDIWQRGTSFTSWTLYKADRWKGVSNTNDTVVISRQAFTLGQTDVPGEPEYFMKVAITAGTTGTFSQIDQSIEGVRTLAGQTVTLSFYAKASSAVTMPGTILNQVFGTGGAPSSSVATSTSSTDLTTAWQRFTKVIALPSITGKTLGTDGNDNLGLLFRLPFNTTVNIDMALVQLEKGPVATEFEQRPFAQELWFAQRYFEKTFPYDTAPAQNAGVADALCYNALLAGVNKFNLNWYFKVPKRTDPTITYYNPSAANALFRNTPDAGDSGTPATDVLSPNYVFIRNPQAATDGVGEQICIHADAAAEY